MIEQRFDELFRDKLTTYSQSPPPETIKKLEAKLRTRKRNSRLKLTLLAAAILCVAISVYAIQRWIKEEPMVAPMVINQAGPFQETTSETESETVLPDRIDHYPLQDTEPSTPVVHHVTGESSDKANGTVDKQELSTAQKISQEPVVSDSEDNNISADQIVEQPSKPGAPELSKPSRPKVTITYKKSSAPPEKTLAMQERAKEEVKGLKKLWIDAQRISYNDISLAGIRETKDQLFAINKKSKTKESKPD